MKAKVKVEREPVCIRTWNRDGTKNRMTLNAAIGNLLQNGHGQKGAGVIAAELLAGKEMYTPLASIRLR